MESKIQKFFKYFHPWISKSEQTHRIAQKSMKEIKKSLDFFEKNLEDGKFNEVVSLVGI